MGPIVLALDLFHGITFACSQSAGVAYMNEIIPDSYEASGQGILVLVRGLGGTIGLAFGGIVQENIGARHLYSCLGLIVFGGLSSLISVSIM